MISRHLHKNLFFRLSILNRAPLKIIARNQNKQTIIINFINFKERCMKVKSLFFLTCAIAALTSCSQNDDEIPGIDSNAPEAKVVIKLAGNGNQADSRAAGLPTNETLLASNQKVNDLTIFVFNSSGNVIAKKYIDTPAQGANEVSTTTDATEVAVVTNTGDQTTTGGMFVAVSSKTALKAVLANMLAAPTDPAGAVTQKDDNLYMSGLGTLSAFTKVDEVMKANVTIQLNYLSARIQLKEITFNGKAVQDNKYVQASSFDTTDDANFTITRVYLMNVQRATHFLPATESGTDYIAQDDKQYTGGVTWSAPWTGGEPNSYKPNNEYTIEAGSDKFTAVTNKISDIGHWYTFANTGVSDIAKHPTALVVEVKWRKTQADSGQNIQKEDKPLYFTVYFGGGDKAELLPGKVYTVSLALNGNFKPTNDGGTGGGGTEDPTKPTVSSAIEVTVTPADWTLEPEISKEWT